MKIFPKEEAEATQHLEIGLFRKGDEEIQQTGKRNAAAAQVG